MSAYEIGPVGEMHAVFKGGRQVSPAARDRKLAEQRLEMLQRREARDLQDSTQRLCLCCSKPFFSEGAHHRLCSVCGKSADGLDNQMMDAGGAGSGGKVLVKGGSK